MDRSKNVGMNYITSSKKFTTSLVYRNAVLTSLEVVRKDVSFIRDTKSICFVLGPELILLFVNIYDPPCDYDLIQFDVKTFGTMFVMKFVSLVTYINIFHFIYILMCV